MKRFLLLISLFFCLLYLNAQMPKVYDEQIEPISQIDKAVNEAKKNNKYVVCQVGGNWCSWCLRFADFIKKDADIRNVIDENYVYIHVNYPRRDASPDLMNRLNNPGRFGFPVFVVLDTDGKVIHIQDSSFLEEGEGYSKEKVLRFFNSWTPEAVNPKK